MMNFVTRLGALGAVAVLATTATGAAQPAMSATKMGGKDQAFVTKAAQGGMAEVKLAGVAIRTSKNPTVLTFAHRMVTDHTKNNDQLAGLAKAGGYTLPSGVGPQNAAVAAKLQPLSGAAFDRAYISAQVAGHQQMLALMKTEASRGKDPHMAAFAKSTAPVVEQHLALAQTDAAKLK